MFLCYNLNIEINKGGITMNEITFDNITLDELDNLKKFLSAKTKFQDIDIQDIISFVRKEENTKYYFDTSLSSSDERDSMYLWLDTGFKDTRNRPLFISLINYHGYFTGHIVGDPDGLMQNMARFNKVNEKIRLEKLRYFESKYKRKTEGRTHTLNEKYKDKPISETKPKETGKENERGVNNELIKRYWNSTQVLDITKEIEKVLIINKWNSINGLDRYIKVIGTRLQQLVDKKKTEYYVLNNIQSAICNTGLLNTFGEDIYVMYRKNLSYGFYAPYKIILDKQQYINEGFTREQSSTVLEPITFFDNNNRVFSADVEDINFNPHDWLHIIEERRSRFPKDLQGISDVALISQIKQSLDIGLKLQKRDMKFAKPYFSASTGSIAWTLPFFANGDFMAAPELVLVIVKFGSFYQLKTILPYDDKVKDKLMDMSIYSKLW